MEGQIKIRTRRKSGFTLIEILVDISIIALVGLAVLSAYTASYKALDLARAKIGAVALANEKMEELRNMPYDYLATQHGPIYPAGNLLDNETITRKGIQFNVKIAISYIDDPFDGNAEGSVAGKPRDLYPYDYKKAEVTVSKVGKSGFLARLTSNIAAKAAETPSNSGIVKICVIDAAGGPIAEANVTISNNEVSPTVNISAETDADGCILVPNLPPDGHNHYHLTATKDGFSTDMTYERTAQNPNALYPNIDVLIQQITSQTLIIDKLSTLSIDIVDINGNPVPSTNLHIEGSKLKYFNPNTPKYSSDQVTDVNGHLELPNMEFDSYRVSIPGQTIITTSPYQPLDLRPNSSLAVRIMIGSSSLPSIISVEPLTAKTGAIASLTVVGTNFHNSTIKLVNQSGTEIVGTNVSITANSNIDADFNLSGAAIGAWDIVIQNGTGEIVRQINGFLIQN